MKIQYSLLMLLPLFLAVFVYTILNSRTGEINEGPINAIIGDESYVEIYGEKPGDDVPDYIRIQTHLQYVEQKLRDKPTDHLTPSQAKNRLLYLDYLNDYHQAGNFPYNDGHPDPRRPTFIDKKGNICAVGYLVEQSSGREMAEALVSEGYKYAYIPEIENQAFDSWVTESGFTQTELAMIQPAYHSRGEDIKRTTNEISTFYGLGTALTVAANTVYYTNRAQDPWLLSNPRYVHLFGMASGLASITLGSTNLNTTNIYYEHSEENNWCMRGCIYHKVTETNRLRAGISAANLGIGAVTIVRSAYHLFFSPRQEPSRTELGVTQLNGVSPESNEPIPAIRFNLNF